MASILINSAVATVIFASGVLAAVQPQVVKWSDKSYGPDGPWAAVTVEIGAPSQSVDLLPGGSWMTNIFGVDICKNSVDCPAEDAGLYDMFDSESFLRIGGTGRLKDNFNKNPGSISAITLGEAGWVFDDVVISATQGAAGFMVPIPLSTFSMLVFEKAVKSLPDGTQYPPTIGKLALGSPNKNQTWANGPETFNGSLLTSAVFEQGKSPSDSYSMHVGSVQMNIPPDLVLGGYHQDRVIGRVSVQPYAFDTLPIDLLDISIGVGEGASPFDFTSKAGLLAEGDATFQAGQQVTIDATQPYLYLPPTTCAAIANNLPVYYEKKFGLFFWDTTSPKYRKIINSPAYLGFTFRESASVTKNITVKVPFSLLNLTLGDPIISKPRQYFPCFAGRDPTARWSLGRSFMQAAFVGVKWEDGGGNWFFAQGPGPNTPKTVSPLAIDEMILSSKSKWEDTWKGFWNVQEVQGEESNTTTTETKTEEAGSTATLGSKVSSSAPGTTAAGADGSDGSNGKDGSSGPPIGAIAGGAVGGVLLFGSAIVIFIFFRRRKAKKPTGAELQGTEDKNSVYEYKAELCGEREMAEMEGKSYQGRFGQPEGQEWRGNGYAHHGQGLGLGLGRGGHVSVYEMGTERAPVEMYAPWSPKGI